MNAILYNYNGPANTINKTLGDGATIAISLRGDFCSLIDPVFVVRLSKFDYNYIHVPEFNRYYFVTGTKILPSGKIEIRCHVDVLKTYSAKINTATATAISSNTADAYISKRENVFDTRPQFSKIDFPNKECFTNSGSIIMVTLQGD